MLGDNFCVDTDTRTKEMIQRLKTLSLNLTAKWRVIRESEDLGKRYRLRPRLTGDYSKGVI